MRDARAIRAGLAAPVLFVSIFVMEGWLRVGYDSRTMYISSLSLGPRGWVQVLNFVIFGLLLLAFARVAGSRTSSHVGAALLTAIAIGNLIIGPFVMDPAGTSPTMRSTHGLVHGIVARMVLAAMPVSCFVFARAFRREARWQFLRWFSLAAGTATAIAVVLLGVATTADTAIRSFGTWLGLIERIAVLPFLMWLFVFAMKLRKAGM